MSFPLRHCHLPSPLQQSVWPSPPASDDEDSQSSGSASSKAKRDRALWANRDRRTSLSSYACPPTPSVDVYTQSSFCRPASSRLSRASEANALSLAWAIIRLRHPILASICLIDSYGASSFAYDLPKDIDAAVADAEGSTELKHFSNSTGMRPAEELEDAYKGGICKVSRSHLSHLLVSTSHGSGSPGIQSISPPSTPSTDSPPRLFAPVHQSTAMTEYNLLLCTPHYVSTPMALASILSELAALLSDPSATEYTLRQTLAMELNAKSLARQQRTSPLKSTGYSASPAFPEFKIRMPTEVRGRRPALPVVATAQPQRA